MNPVSVWGGCHYVISPCHGAISLDTDHREPLWQDAGLFCTLYGYDEIIL